MDANSINRLFDRLNNQFFSSPTAESSVSPNATTTESRSLNQPPRLTNFAQTCAQLDALGPFDISTEGPLSSDESIEKIMINSSANPVALSSTPPIPVNRSASLSPDRDFAAKKNLIQAAETGNQLLFEKLLFDHSSNSVNLSDVSTPLIANSIRWHLQSSQMHNQSGPVAVDEKIIKRLLELGARVNTLDESVQDDSALWMSLQQSNEKITELLLNYGCDPNASCALTNAAKNGAINHLHILLKYGANPNLPQNGKYPLNEACLRGDLNMATLLLRHGAKVHEDGAEVTVLMSACMSGNSAICKLLIQSGARNHFPTPDQLANFALHMAGKYIHSNAQTVKTDLSALLHNIAHSEADDLATILSVADGLLNSPQFSDHDLGFFEKKLFGHFCIHFDLANAYFSTASAGSSQISKTKAMLDNMITDNNLIQEFANLFAAAKSRRNETAFNQNQ